MRELRISSSLISPARNNLSMIKIFCSGTKKLRPVIGAALAKDFIAIWVRSSLSGKMLLSTEKRIRFRSSKEKHSVLISSQIKPKV